MRLERSIIAVATAIALFVMSIPLNGIYAAKLWSESQGTLTLSDSAVTFSADDYENQVSRTVSVTGLDGNDELYGEITSCTYTWTSDNDGVATVDDNGTIHPIAAGSTTVTCTAKYEMVSGGDTTYESASASVAVEVYEYVKVDIEVMPSDTIPYPTRVQIVATVDPQDASAVLIVDGVLQPALTTALDLNPRTYVATVSTGDCGYYKAVTVDKTFFVTQGEAVLSVVGGVDSAYYGQSETFTVEASESGVLAVTATNAMIEGADEQGVKTIALGSNLSADVKVTYNNLGSADVKFSFIPDDGRYKQPDDFEVSTTVNKIPVNAVWSGSFTKVYDGSAEYVPATAPVLELADGLSGFPITATVSTGDAGTCGSFILVDEAGNVVDKPDAGTYKAVYNGALKLENGENYELKNPVPENTVTITPVILSEDNINKGVGADKCFDGSSTAKFATIPTLVEDDKFIGDEFDDLVLAYEANYYKDNVKTAGSHSAVTDGTIIKLENLAVNYSDGTLCGNYVFPDGTTIALDGTFTIDTNEGFVAFTGGIANLPEPDDNGVFWFKEETKIEKDGFQFREVKQETGWPWDRWADDWADSYTVTEQSHGKEIVAKKVGSSNISNSITLGYDDDKPLAIFGVSVNGGEIVNITEFTTEYKSISKDSVVHIAVNVSDAKSQVKAVSYVGLERTLADLTAEYWPTDKEEKVNLELDMTEEGSILLKEVTSIDELKMFYYVKVTDYAGNDNYFASAGVLQDNTAPVITSVSMGDSQGNYEDIPVYVAGNIDFKVNFEENGFASGVSNVYVAVTLNGTTVSTGDAITNTYLWETSDDLTAIQNLNGDSAPSAVEIDAASGALELKGAIHGLADGNKYTLSIAVEDKAGNRSEVAIKEFIVDSQKPVVDINLDGLQYNINRKESGSESEPKQYTGGSVVVTISDMTLVTDLSTLLTNVNGVSWEKTVATDGMATYKATIKFGKGATNLEGVYELLVNVADCLGRTAGGSEIINVDATAPTYKVAFSEQAAEATKIGNVKYYNKDIVASFVVEEEGSYEDELLTITVTDATQRTVIQWKDGIATTVEGDTNYILIHEEDSKEFVLTIKADTETHATDNAGYVFTITGQDVAGNELVADASVGTAISEIRAMDTVVPELASVTYETLGEFHTVGGRDYVNADTKVTFVLNEASDVLSSYTLTQNGETPQAVEWITNGNTKTFEVVVSQFGDKGDLQTLTLYGKDYAGNTMIMTGGLRSELNTGFADGLFVDNFTVDTVAPTIRYEYLTYSPDRLGFEGADYFKQPISLRVTVDEHNFDESLLTKEVSGFIDGVVYEESAWEKFGDIYTKIFNFNVDSMYNISIKGVDCANNPIKLLESTGISAKSPEEGMTTLSLAVDGTIPAIGDSSKPVVVISPGSTGATALAYGSFGEHPLYNSNVTFEVAVYDPQTFNFCSGIDGVTFNVSAESGAKATASFAASGQISNGNGVTVSLASGDASKYGRGKDNQLVFHVTIDKSVFNSNGISLSVDTKDFSTNTSAKTSSVVAIDVTQPVVSITYDNNDISNERYFHQERVATIEVIERNFSNDCIDFVVNGERQNLEFVRVNGGGGNRDDSVWRATYVFDVDDDYVVDCTVMDRVKNVGTVSYAGEAPQDFTVDLTFPEISVSFDNNEAVNENYYAAARTATIRIEEHNFRAEDVVITGTALDDGKAITYPVTGRWSSNGDVHTAVIEYVDDAHYTLDVAYTDLATNVAEEPATSRFVIDNIDPVLEITGVTAGTPYADSVVPQIDFSDTNYEDIEIILTRTVREESDVDVTDLFVGETDITYSAAGRGVGSNTIADIAHEAGNDGIYTLYVKVTDKAGRSAEETITYSVNRFGSVYVYSDDLINLIGGYHQAVDGDLFITAYNANALLNDSTKLQITCDGSAVSGQKSSANPASDLIDNSNWYVYKFKLDTADFAADGSYEITLSDKDDAGNVRTNADAPIRFFVDTTAPVLDSLIGLEEAIINAEFKDVDFVISDAIGLKMIQIFVDGVLVATMDQFDVVTYHNGNFRLNEGMKQQIRLVATDMAGNVLDSASENFTTAFAFNDTVTVTTNVFELWYANTGLFWGSIAGIGGIAAVGVMTAVFAKRKKKTSIEDI